MNTIRSLNGLTLQIRTRPFEIILNDRITELTIHTGLSQEMVMGELLSSGYGVGGSMEGVLLRPLALAAGYAIGSNVDGYVTYYLAAKDGYTVGGVANPVLLDYVNGFSDGYSVGGECATILTRRRYMSEVDPMSLSDLDSMMISDIEFITLE